MQRTYLAARRVLDVLVSAAILILLVPVFVVVALLILLKMGRPIFFKQKRQGHRKQFSILKFRTMINDAEHIGGGYMRADMNLVPPLGAFLRKTSLDELPQLLNIFRGDMSFVGPRPALPSQVARYTDRQTERLKVPQGVTGLAQLQYRNDAPWSKRIESDLEYVDSIGPLTDLKILFATPSKVLRGSGVRMDQTAADVDDLAPQTKWEEKG